MIKIYGEARTQYLLNAAITEQEINQMRDSVYVGQNIFIRFRQLDDSGNFILCKPEWCTVKIKSTYVVVLTRENGREAHLTYIDLCMLERDNELQRK